MGAAESSIFSLIARNDVGGVLTLIQEGEVNVNRLDDNGNSPLFHATVRELVEMCAILLQNGAAADVPNARGQTPLYIAASVGNAEIVRLLLRAGADPSRSCRGETPIGIARSRGHAQVVADLEVCMMVCTRRCM